MLKVGDKLFGSFNYYSEEDPFNYCWESVEVTEVSKKFFKIDRVNGNFRIEDLKHVEYPITLYTKDQMKNLGFSCE